MQCLDLWLESHFQALEEFQSFSDSQKERSKKKLKVLREDALLFILSGTPQERLRSELHRWDLIYSERVQELLSQIGMGTSSEDDEFHRQITQDIREGISEALEAFGGPEGFDGAFARLKLLETKHSIAVPAQLDPSGPYWVDLNPKYNFDLA